MAIAGRIMPMPRGVYEASMVYNALDIVRYENKPWICVSDNTVGITPSEDYPDIWMLFIDVSIADADTLDGHDSEYFAKASDLAKLVGEPIKVTFFADGWSDDSPYTQTIDVDTMTANDVPIPLFVDDGGDEDSSKNKLKSYGYVSYFDSEDGAVIATCKYKKPDVDFTVAFKGV